MPEVHLSVNRVLHIVSCWIPQGNPSLESRLANLQDQQGGAADSIEGGEENIPSTINILDLKQRLERVKRGGKP